MQHSFNIRRNEIITIQGSRLFRGKKKVRREAALILGCIRGNKCQAYLQQALLDKDSTVKKIRPGLLER